MLLSGRNKRATLPSWWEQGNLSRYSLDLPKYRPEAKACVSWDHFPNKLPAPSKEVGIVKEKKENAWRLHYWVGCYCEQLYCWIHAILGVLVEYVIVYKGSRKALECLSTNFHSSLVKGYPSGIHVSISGLLCTCLASSWGTRESPQAEKQREASHEMISCQ